MKDQNKKAIEEQNRKLMKPFKSSSLIINTLENSGLTKALKAMEEQNRELMKLFKNNSSLTINTLKNSGLTKALKAIEEQNRELMKPFKNNSSLTINTLKNSGLTKALKAIEEQNRELMKPFKNRSLINTLTKVGLEIQELEKRKKIPPSIERDNHLYGKFLTFHKTLGEKVDYLKALGKFLDKEILTKILEIWKTDTLFRERAEIFLDAFLNHSEKRYTVSIPALLPHIEFLCLSLINKENKRFNKEIKEIFYKTFSKCSPSESLPFSKYKFFCQNHKELFSCEDKTQPDFLNRHKVLHGKDIKYYKKSDNSLVCIIILDILFYMRKELKEEFCSALESMNNEN